MLCWSINRNATWSRLASLAGFVRSLKRHLRLGNAEFNVCFVDDQAIRRLNAAYRGKDKATDVLSFAWNESTGPRGRRANSPSPGVGREEQFPG